MSVTLAETTSGFEFQPLFHGLRHLREWVRPGNQNQYSSYQDWAFDRSLAERDALLSRIENQVRSAELHPRTLLIVIGGEAHERLLQRAVETFLQTMPCHLDDEYASVREIVEMVDRGSVENAGAVLGVLVSLGNRDVNGIVRVVRQSLNAEEVRNFSRSVPSVVQVSHIDFCVEWLTELYHARAPSRSAITSVTCAMMLAVLKSESCTVESTEGGIGFAVPGHTRKIPFAEFADELVSRLEMLKTGRDVDYEIDKVIHLWRAHHQSRGEESAAAA